MWYLTILAVAVAAIGAWFFFKKAAPTEQLDANKDGKVDVADVKAAAAEVAVEVKAAAVEVATEAKEVVAETATKAVAKVKRTAAKKTAAKSTKAKK